MKKQGGLSPELEHELAAAMGKLDDYETESAGTCLKYECNLVTPMYGGGVLAGEVDREMPVRATAIRGQLRFWWRLLAMHGPLKLKGKELFAAERDIWGGLGDIKSLAASKVQVRARKVGSIETKAYAQYVPGKTMPNWDQYTPAYALFGAEKVVNKQKIPCALSKPGMRFEFELNFSSLMSENDRASVQEAVRWWASFGGLGARTRRGVGAVQVLKGLSPVGASEVSGLGGSLVLSSQHSEATKAWEVAVNKLRDFRQKPGIARGPNNPRPGRSFWPEPDAVRRITGQKAANHAPVHAAGNVFPRAAFGLPIIFHFNTYNSPEDPQDTTLQARGKDRMASPLILRPYWDGKGWRAAALLLPGYEEALTQTLQLSKYPEEISVWPSASEEQADTAKKIKPMFNAAKNENRADDPLQAFLQFFREG